MNVAVVMTVFNTPGDWIVEAVGSVRGDCSVIAVSDGSDRADTLVALMALWSPGINETVCHIPHSGIAAASNFGISQTDAPLIARLDSDDRMLPGTIATLSAYLEAHPTVDVVSGAMHYIRPDGTRFGEVRPPVMHNSRQHRGYVAHSGCMFRRSIWEKAGGYPDTRRRGADWRFWQACEAVGARFSVLPHFTIERRVHPDSVSFKQSKHLQQMWQRAQR